MERYNNRIDVSINVVLVTNRINIIHHQDGMKQFSTYIVEEMEDGSEINFKVIIQTAKC